MAEGFAQSWGRGQIRAMPSPFLQVTSSSNINGFPNSIKRASTRARSARMLRDYCSSACLQGRKRTSVCWRICVRPLTWTAPQFAGWAAGLHGPATARFRGGISGQGLVQRTVLRSMRRGMCGDTALGIAKLWRPGRARARATEECRRDWRVRGRGKTPVAKEAVRCSGLPTGAKVTALPT